MFYEVILDAGETPNKCTIAALGERSDFHLFKVKGDCNFGPLRSSFLLHHQGQCLASLIKEKSEIQGIASVDCVWRRLEGLLKRIVDPCPQRVSIPFGFITAYPRLSLKNRDPAQGLATIEAIFVAAALLGNWDPSLLSKYYFGHKFVKINRERFLELGVHQAGDPTPLPALSSRSRNSLQRRRDRGRL